MSMRMKCAIGGSTLAVLAAAGTWMVAGGCTINTEITKPHREHDLRRDEIRALLESGDFQRKLDASRQIDKLEPDEKLDVLQGLARHRDPAVRLMAVKRLRTIDDPRARETLAALAAEDADDTVRELAAGK